MGHTQTFSEQGQIQDRINLGKRTHQTSMIGQQQERLSMGNIVTVLDNDTSGSTSANAGKGDNKTKIDSIKEADSIFVANLDPQAWIAVISFDHDARVIWPMSQVGNKKGEIIRAIQTMNADGGTCMYKGLDLSLREFAKAPEGKIKSLYVESDGLNTGEDPTPLAAQIKAKGIQIHTIGFGEQNAIDEALLRQIASEAANGTPLYNHITSSRGLTSFMQRESQQLVPRR